MEHCKRVSINASSHSEPCFYFELELRCWAHIHGASPSWPGLEPRFSQLQAQCSTTELFRWAGISILWKASCFVMFSIKCVFVLVLMQQLSSCHGHASLDFSHWLNSVTERINQTMHYSLSGKLRGLRHILPVYVEHKTRSSCFPWMASLSRWLVFGMVHVLSCGVDTLWVGLGASGSASDERESTKWCAHLNSNPTHLVKSQMCCPPNHRLSPMYV